MCVDVHVSAVDWRPVHCVFLLSAQYTLGLAPAIGHGWDLQCSTMKTDVYCHCGTAVLSKYFFLTNINVMWTNCIWIQPWFMHYKIQVKIGLYYTDGMNYFVSNIRIWSMQGKGTQMSAPSNKAKMRQPSTNCVHHPLSSPHLVTQLDHESEVTHAEGSILHFLKSSKKYVFLRRAAIEHCWRVCLLRASECSCPCWYSDSYWLVCAGGGQI